MEIVDNKDRVADKLFIRVRAFRGERKQQDRNSAELAELVRGKPAEASDGLLVTQRDGADNLLEDLIDLAGVGENARRKLLT